MKTLLSILTFLIITASAFAVDYDKDEVYSDHMPAVERLQGCILFPADIQIVDVPGEKTEETRKSFRYRLYRLKDTKQTIVQDRVMFIADNAACIAEAEVKKLPDILAEVEKETVKAEPGTWVKSVEIAEIEKP